MRKLEEDKVSCWTGVGFLVSLHLPTCGGTDNIHPFIHALCLVVVVMYVGVGDIYHQVYIGPTDVVWCVVCVAIYHCGERFGECSAADFPPSVAATAAAWG